MGIMKSTKPIILASNSPRRKEMLENLGIDFEVIPSNIDEIRKTGEIPTEFVRRAALEKGIDVLEKLALENHTPWIIAADTVVVLGDEILCKPKDKNDSKDMITKLSGKTHSVITGWVVGRKGEKWHVDHTGSQVTFHDLSTNQIDNYVATNEGMDKAGSYAIQGIGSFLVKGINGNYLNVVGLPISYVVRVLIDVGALPGFLKQ